MTQEHSLCAYRPETKVPGHHIPPRPGLKNDSEIVKAFYNVEKISLKDRKLFLEVSQV